MRLALTPRRCPIEVIAAASAQDRGLPGSRVHAAISACPLVWATSSSADQGKTPSFMAVQCGRHVTRRAAVGHGVALAPRPARAGAGQPALGVEPEDVVHPGLLGG